MKNDIQKKAVKNGFFFMADKNNPYKKFISNIFVRVYVYVLYY